MARMVAYLLAFLSGICFVSAAVEAKEGRSMSGPLWTVFGMWAIILLIELVLRFDRKERKK